MTKEAFIKLLIAFGIEFSVFFIYTVIDVKILTSKKPLLDIARTYWYMAPFYAGIPLVVWWAYRVIFSTVGNNQIWLSLLISSLVVYIAILSATYIASDQLPTRNQVIALCLKGIALVIANL